MPVYNCYRGHTEGIAREREGYFVIRDLRDRDWACFESSLPSLAGVDREALIQQNAREIAERTVRLMSLGMDASRSACTVVECASTEELPRLLAESKDADEAEAG